MACHWNWGCKLLARHESTMLREPVREICRLYNSGKRVDKWASFKMLVPNSFYFSVFHCIWHFLLYYSHRVDVINLIFNCLWESLGDSLYYCKLYDCSLIFQSFHKYKHQKFNCFWKIITQAFIGYWPSSGHILVSVNLTFLWFSLWPLEGACRVAAWVSPAEWVVGLGEEPTQSRRKAEIPEWVE